MGLIEEERTGTPHTEGRVLATNEKFYNYIVAFDSSERDEVIIARKNVGEIARR